MNSQLSLNYSDKILPISSIDQTFRDNIKKIPPKDSPDISSTYFPQGFYFPSENETDSKDLIEYHYDDAYYHALREIDWNVFLTLKFKQWRFKSLSHSAFKRRKEFLWDLVHQVISELELSLNDLQYFWSEEANSDDEAHFHGLFYSVYPEKCSVGDLLKSIVNNLDPDIVQIPRPATGQEPPHIQRVKSSERVARYLLKTPKNQVEPKVLGHSLKFVRFWNRHRQWKMKRAATDQISSKNGIC